MNLRLISLFFSLYFGVVLSVTRKISYKTDCFLYNRDESSTVTSATTTITPTTFSPTEPQIPRPVTTGLRTRKKRYVYDEWQLTDLIKVSGGDKYELYLLFPNQTSIDYIDCSLRFMPANQITRTDTRYRYFTGMEYRIEYNRYTSFSTPNSCNVEIFLYSSTSAHEISYYTCDEQLITNSKYFSGDREVTYKTTDPSEWLGIRMTYNYPVDSAYDSIFNSASGLKGTDYNAKITIKTYNSSKSVESTTISSGKSLSKGAKWAIFITILVVIFIVVIASAVCKKIEEIKAQVTNPISALGGGGGTAGNALVGMAGGALAGGALGGMLGGGSDKNQQNYAPPPTGPQPYNQQAYATPTGMNGQLGYHPSQGGYGQPGYPPASTSPPGQPWYPPIIPSAVTPAYPQPTESHVGFDPTSTENNPHAYPPRNADSPSVFT